MTAWQRFKDRMNERSTWATVYAAIVASMPAALSMEAPWNVVFILAAFLGALIPDGKVVKGTEA